MKNIVLSKQSSENEIKTYFEKVLELNQSGDEYPVDLELVWPLIYSEKSKSVRALTSDFIQDVDYKVLAINGENPLGGRPSENYKLTIPCMEYFVARKVRPVFEVYRKVFHKSIEQKQLSTLDILELTIKELRSHSQELQEVKRDVFELKARTTTRPEYFTVAGYAVFLGFTVTNKQAGILGRRATKICKERNLPIEDVPDTRWGKVGSYPKNILDEVFNEPIN